MVKLLEMPKELLEHIFSFVRLAGVPLKMEELRHLANIRCVHRIFAHLLPTDSILSAVHIDIRKDNKVAVMLFASHLARSKPQLPTSQLVIHCIAKDSSTYDPSSETRILETSLVQGCKRVLDCTFFASNGREPLRGFTSLRALRRLAVNCHYACFLGGIVAHLRSLDTLVLYPIHKPGQPCGRPNPSCIMGMSMPNSFKIVLPSKMANVHLEAASTSCMHVTINMLSMRPAYLSLHMDASNGDIGAVGMAKAVIGDGRVGKVKELSIAGLDRLNDGQEARAILQHAAVEHGFTIKEQEHCNLPGWVMLPVL